MILSQPLRIWISWKGRIISSPVGPDSMESTSVKDKEPSLHCKIVNDTLKVIKLELLGQRTKELNRQWVESQKNLQIAAEVNFKPAGPVTNNHPWRQEYPSLSKLTKGGQPVNQACSYAMAGLAVLELADNSFSFSQPFHWSFLTQQGWTPVRNRCLNQIP